MKFEMILFPDGKFSEMKEQRPPFPPPAGALKVKMHSSSTLFSNRADLQATTSLRTELSLTSERMFARSPVTICW